MQARRMARVAPFVWPTVAALLIVVAVPIFFVVLQAVFPRIGEGSLADPFTALARTLGDAAVLQLTINTLRLGIAVILTVIVVAVPLGALRALFRVPLAPLWDFVFLVPFFIPPYIATLGWILTLQPRGYLAQLTGSNAAAFLFSFSGIVFVMTLHAFPVVYFAVSRTVAAVGNRYGDVARVFGASPAAAFLRVTLPLAAPGLTASLLLAFAMTIEEYGTPAALGRQVGFGVLATGIEARVADWPIDLSGAAILSLILVMLSLAAFVVQHRILARRSFDTSPGRPQDTERRPLRGYTAPVLVLFALVAACGAVLPMFAIFATAFSRTLSGGLAAGNLGLHNFSLILADDSGALNALGTSLGLAAATALVTGILGAVAAYAVVKTRLRGRFLLDALTILPNAVPGVVVAVGLIVAWNEPALPVTPYDTPVILLLAYCCLLLPYPARYAGGALRQVGDNLEAAARVAGASPWTAFRRVIVPLILPSMIAAMLLVFAIASRELVASIMVTPVGLQTIATFIWQQFEQGSIELGMAMSAIAIIITTAIPLLVMLTARRLRLSP
jgi:iron(III) transport system permease protein